MQAPRRLERASRGEGWAALVMGPVPRRIAMALAALLALVLAAAIIELVEQPPVNLAEAAVQQLPTTGVQNPVTGVLLNYRAYDTWLELGVLLLAMMGSLALLRAGDLHRIRNPGGDDPLPDALVGLFVPLMVLAGGYLLWRGTHAPGGAFQAGALWAAAGVVSRLAGIDGLRRVPGPLLRCGHALAFTAVMVAGALVAVRHGAFLEFPPERAAAVIFGLELLAAGSIALTLWSLYVAAGPADDGAFLPGRHGS